MIRNFASLFVVTLVPLVARGAGAPNAVAPDPAGTVSGKATFVGKPPPRKTINVGADPGCRLHKPPRTEDVIVDNAGGLKNVIVYVKKGLPEGKKHPAPTEAVVIDQVGCRYDPHVVGVMVGQTLKVTNGDETLHNVHGLPFDNPGFNVVQAKKGSANTFTFKSPEVPGFVLKCDVHAWMRSYVWVFDHPYFAVSKEDGSFSLPPLPPGTYTIGAWQETCTAQEQEVKVEAGGKINLTFKFEPEKKEPK
jgi:plastocyanin